MQTRCLGGFSITWVPKLILTPKKIWLFGPKRAKFGPNWHFWPFLSRNILSWAHIGLAGSFGALLVVWLVVVARGLYLARHLFSLVCY